MKKLFLLFALVGMFATACEVGGVNGPTNTPTEKPDDGNGETLYDAYIALNKDIITFAPDGGSLDIKVYSNYEWTLTNNCDWVTTSVTGGEASDAGTTVTLTADLTYDDREGTITFSCGKAKKLLVVSQSFKEAIIADENNVFNVPAEGGNVIINYQTTVECEIIIPEEAQSWISLADDTRGLVSESVVLNIAPNNSVAEKSAIIKVVKVEDTSISAEYIITQERNMDCIFEYTSANGSIVTPYDSSAFGATILSNEYIDGKGYIEFDAPVTSIGYEAFYNCTSLTSVTIPDSVTEIGGWAFYWCTSLTSVTIGNSVTLIGENAFYNCESLTSVTIPDSVTEIGNAAFVGCDSLTSFYGKFTSVDNRCLIVNGKLIAFTIGCGATEYTIPDSVTEIGDYAFAGCYSLTSVTIPDSITSIGEWAFYYCSSLTSFYGKFASVDNRCLIANGKLIAFAPAGLTEYTIPGSVTEIGYHAFKACYSLTSITIPDSVTTIGQEAFRYCYSLESVTIGNGVTTIGDYAFYHCTSLTSVTIGNSVTSIGYKAFYWCSGELIINSKIIETDYSYDNCPANSSSGWLYESGFTKLTIGDSITKIGESAFRGCDSLTSVTIPDSVTKIGNYAFYWCTSLTSVTIPDSVTEIGEWVFYNCTSLTSVTIPDSVTEIGIYAFNDCESLTSVIIPDSVTTIGQEAFSWCTSLKEVYCKPTTPPTGGSSMFYGNASGRKIYVPMESVGAYKTAEGWSNYASDIVGYNF